MKQNLKKNAEEFKTKIDKNNSQPSIAASIDEIQKPAIEKRIDMVTNWFDEIPREVFSTDIGHRIAKAVFTKMMKTGDRYVRVKLNQNIVNSFYELKVRTNPNDKFCIIDMPIHIDTELRITIDSNGFNFKIEPNGPEIWFAYDFQILFFKLIEE